MQESSREYAAGTLYRLWIFLVLDIGVSLCLEFVQRSGEANSLGLLRDLLRGRMGADSAMYMDHAWTVLHRGLPLYETVFFQEHLKFIYPTSSLLVYGLAATMHWSGAGLIVALVWMSLAGILWLAGEVLLGVLDGSAVWGRWERLQVRLLAALLAVFFYPVVSGVSLGQIQTLLACLWMLSVLAWMRGRQAGAGVCLGLICAFKPTLAVFLLWAILRRQWRFLWAFAGTTAAIQGVAAGLFGWQNAVEYLRVLSFLGRHGEAFWPNQSVNGLLERWLHNGDCMRWSGMVYPPYNRAVFVGTMLSSGVLIGFGLWFPLARRWRDSAADFLLFGMLATVASPVAWVHHYSCFFPGCLYLLGSMLKARGLLPVGAGACFLVLTNAWSMLAGFGETAWNPVLSYELYAGLGLMVAMVIWVDGRRDRFLC
jgi:hypothetical protein